MTGVKRNYLLHESAHAVAHAMLPHTGAGVALRQLPLAADQFIVRSILEESFANTVERVGFGLAKSSMHQLLYAFNSYIPFQQPQVGALCEAIAQFGFGTVFAMGYLLHYASNWPPQAITSADLQRWLDKLAPQGGDRCAQLLRAGGFHVNPKFRDETTPAYFALHGYEDAFARLSVDGVQGGQDSMVLECATVFAGIAEHGLESAQFSIAHQAQTN